MITRIRTNNTTNDVAEKKKKDKDNDKDANIDPNKPLDPNRPCWSLLFLNGPDCWVGLQ